MIMGQASFHNSVGSADTVADATLTTQANSRRVAGKIRPTHVFIIMESQLAKSRTFHTACHSSRMA